MVALTACSQASIPPMVIAENEGSPAPGGGGPLYNEQAFVEGLVVVGAGTVSAEPEIAVVTFGVELRGDDPARMVTEAAGKIERAIAAAEGLGVTEEEIETTNYTVWVETVYDPETGSPTSQVVYHVSHHVRATLHDLSQVGDLLAVVVDAGANSISGVSFSVEDPSSLIEQARQEALENAVAQARQVANGLDVTLGKPRLVMETGGGYPVGGVGGGGGGMMESAPQVSPGTFSVSVSVQVVYDIR